jgi:hypothetical protein
MRAITTPIPVAWMSEAATALSVTDQTAVVGEVLGRELWVEQLDLEVAKSRSFPEGVPEVVVDSVFGAFGPEAAVLPVSGEVEVLTGRPARTFAHWVARNREALV